MAITVETLRSRVWSTSNLLQYRISLKHFITIVSILKLKFTKVPRNNFFRLFHVTHLYLLVWSLKLGKTLWHPLLRWLLHSHHILLIKFYRLWRRWNLYCYVMSHRFLIYHDFSKNIMNSLTLYYIP